MNQITKRVTATLLSLFLVLGAFIAAPITAHANVEHVEIQIINFPRGGGGGWEMPALNLMNGWDVWTEGSSDIEVGARVPRSNGAAALGCTVEIQDNIMIGEY